MKIKHFQRNHKEYSVKTVGVLISLKQIEPHRYKTYNQNDLYTKNQLSIKETREIYTIE